MDRPRPTARPGLLAAVTIALAVAIWAAGCSESNQVTEPAATGQHRLEAPEPGPVGRTVAVVTTGCGSASASIGSAVRLDGTTVLTAAHVIAGAGDVAVVEHARLPTSREWPAFSPVPLLTDAEPATVVAFDPDRDLALVATAPGPADRPEYDRPEFGTAAVGDVIEIHGASTTAINGSVTQRTTIVADEVRGQGRVRRDGYRLQASTDRGDSGAGVWSTDSRLVGLVFAVSSGDGTRTWAVSGREIVDFLDAVQNAPSQSYRCDQATSRLIAGP